MSFRSASVGRRRRGHAITRLREKILTSALVLFAQNGFEKVTGDQLAAGARVGKGNVYRRFGSKEGLYAATVLVGFRQLVIKSSARSKKSIRSLNELPRSCDTGKPFGARFEYQPYAGFFGRS